MKKNLSYTYIICLLVNTSQAQMAMDTILLPEVKLIESKIATHDVGINIDIVKTHPLCEGSSINLANLISSSTSLYIKKYGALATPTFRGTSSSHTLVLWNGIPINSIANGLSDLSGIYCHNFSQIDIVQGGNASVFGSGAIGGTVHLNSNTILTQKDELSVGATFGSYGLSSHSIGFKINNGKLTTKGSIDFLNHDNNFEFINTTQLGSPSSVNEYGKIKSHSQNIDMVYRLNTNTNYKFSFWASDLEREVSQNMTISSSDAMQYDISKRLLFTLQRKFDYFGVVFKQAHIKEDFRYTEILKMIDSYYIAESHISDLDIKLLKENYLVNIGAAYTNNQIQNNNFLSLSINESNLAAFSALKYESKYFSINSVLRKEWQSSFQVPLIPMLTFEAQIFNALKLKAKYNRNFRSPTYNDRFWVGSGANGNSDLIPEDAFNKELGINLYIKNFNICITAFHLNISDMIFWQQMENGNWMPKNIKKVFSRGIESAVNFSFSNLSFDGNYAFTKSTNELATSSLDITVGEQLRYVPLHKGFLSITLVDKNLKLCLSKSFTGEVVTTYGYIENMTLDSFLLTDFSVTYMSTSFPLLLQAKVRNLMDRSYVTYQNYPNPGREYLFSIEYIFN